MEDNYYINLNTISLSDYAQELETAVMIPSRMILKEDIQRRFECLKTHGINNLNDILVAFKTPEKLKAFAEKSGLPEDYLAMLKREIASSQPKPVNLKDISGIDKDVIRKLEASGINNTKKLFPYVTTPAGREALANQTGISLEVILELTKLTDVSRIKWVGANFARMLVDSEYDTVEKVANADYAKLYTQINAINAKMQFFKGKFGMNDMKLCVLAARNVPKAISY